MRNVGLISELDRFISYSESRLTAPRECLNRVIQEGIVSLDELYERPHDYLILISLLSPQAKAPKIEDLVRHRLNLNRVPASNNQGDAYDPLSNEFTEFKISTSNADHQINAVQLRPWQEIDKYLLGYIDEDDFLQSYFFVLTKVQLVAECELMGASAMHGTSVANANNENVELALRLPIDHSNPHFSRWLGQYSFDELNRFIRGGE